LGRLSRMRRFYPIGVDIHEWVVCHVKRIDSLPLALQRLINPTPASECAPAMMIAGNTRRAHSASYKPFARKRTNSRKNRRTGIMNAAGRTSAEFIPYHHLGQIAMSGGTVERFRSDERDDRDRQFDHIVGKSPALESTLAEVQRVAPTDSTVLLAECISCSRSALT
jgi:transcriptional regulator with PAS, ATPase and Fis domain